LQFSRFSPLFSAFLCDGLLLLQLQLLLQLLLQLQLLLPLKLAARMSATRMNHWMARRQTTATVPVHAAGAPKPSLSSP
jgi:hypothetical protein